MVLPNSLHSRDLINLPRNICRFSDVSSSLRDISRTRERDVLRMALPDVSGFRLRHLPRISSRSAIVLAVLALWMLSGCGLATGTSHSTAAGAPTTAPTTTGSKINGAISNVCPIAQAPDDASAFTPHVIVKEDSGSIHTLALRPNQRLEIRLDSQVQWALRLDDPQHILVSASSQGWYDTTSNACVWRFTAQTAGDAQLAFSGTLPCPPLKSCPSSDRSATYRLSTR